MKEVMRKTLWGLATCLAMLLTAGLASCGSDDEEAEVPTGGVTAAQLTGTWQLVQEKGWEIVGGDKEEYTENVTADNRIYEFRADGTLVDRRNGKTSSWRLTGNTLVVDGEEAYIKSFTGDRLVTEYYTDTEYNQSTYQRVN